MQIVLRSDVSGIGNRGDIVDVADGYARNYLVPRGLAMKATPGGQRQAEAMKRSRDTKDAAARALSEEIARTLVPAVIKLTSKAGKEGKLFGTVTTADIAEAIEAQTGIVLDRKVLELDEHIKNTGEHTVAAKLHADVQFQINLEVYPA